MYLAMMKFHQQHTFQNHKKYISLSLIDQFFGFIEDFGERFFFFFFFILHYKKWGCWYARENVLSKSIYSASFDFMSFDTCKRKSPSQRKYMKAFWMCLRELPCSLTDRQIYSPQHFARPHPLKKHSKWRSSLLKTWGKGKLKKAITQSEYCNIQWSCQILPQSWWQSHLPWELSHHCHVALLKIPLLRTTTLIT